MKAILRLLLFVRVFFRLNRYLDLAIFLRFSLNLYLYLLIVFTICKFVSLYCNFRLFFINVRCFVNYFFSRCKIYSHLLSRFLKYRIFRIFLSSNSPKGSPFSTKSTRSLNSPEAELKCSDFQFLHLTLF